MRQHDSGRGVANQLDFAACTENHMIFAIPCGMVRVMLLRHWDLLVGLAVPLGDPSQLLTLMLNCR